LPFRPLKGLTALQSLNLSGTNVADVGPLKGLTALRSLDLSHTHVTDLGPLKGLPNLRHLLKFLISCPVANGKMKQASL
jgi:Leucine-rich repeat (LRR) protein